MDISDLETKLSTVSKSHREFFVPIVRAIAALGGSARKNEVVAKLREILAPQLNPRQLDFLENKGRLGWARKSLKDHGAITGGFGTWELTELGRAYADAHATDPLTISTEVPESEHSSTTSAVTETVEVTKNEGYEIPLLEVMASGVHEKTAILEAIERSHGTGFLPGDRRRMPGGTFVWRYRAAWALSNLGKNGLAENTGTGQWSITAAGSARLAAEEAAWTIEQYRGSHSRVQVPDGRREEPENRPPTTWAQIRDDLPKSIAERIESRIRPDLGSTPEESIARNIIFYGPPGTGKTHIAKMVALAIAGEPEIREDGRVRLVQFHPSYAYEDFVQGLRPKLEQSQLGYALHKGPFLRIAEAAVQDPDRFYVLIIDEINRGDPARIFGELLYALEYRDEIVTLSPEGTLVVPSNLVILGTMNSVDRSVALVDYALRRRFGFIRLEPDTDVVAHAAKVGVVAEFGPEVLDRINAWIRSRLGREYEIGHSFFIAKSLPDADHVFDRIWALDIAPLLEEYFHGDEASLVEAENQWRNIVKSVLAQRSAKLRAEELLEES
jgi:5-methylcytosine-specific restriction protein B